MTRQSVSRTLFSLMAGLTLAISLTGLGHALNVTEEQIKAKVTAHVQEKLAGMVSAKDQQNVSITVGRVPSAPFNFPETTKAEEITIDTTSRFGDIYSDRGVVQVSITDKQDNHRNIGVPVQVSVKKPVWIVKNPINANEPLRPSDLTLKLKDVSQCYSYAVGEERNLPQYIARVNLRPGDILDSRKMVIPPDVTYNSEVRIFMSNGDGMTVTVPGIALSNGRIGETIRVRQAVFQRKYYSAKIIDKNQVLVEI